MGFSRQEYWSGLPFPSPGDLPDPGIEPRSPAKPLSHQGTELNMPTEVGIIHCRGDQAASNHISQDNNAADREEKRAALLSLAQQFIVIPNIKLLYLPEGKKKCDYYKREPNHKETGYKNRGTMSSLILYTDSYRHSSDPEPRH